MEATTVCEPEASGPSLAVAPPALTVNDADASAPSSVALKLAVFTPEPASEKVTVTFAEPPVNPPLGATEMLGGVASAVNAPVACAAFPTLSAIETTRL